MFCRKKQNSDIFKNKGKCGTQGNNEKFYSDRDKNINPSLVRLAFLKTK